VAGSLGRLEPLSVSVAPDPEALDEGDPIEVALDTTDTLCDCRPDPLRDTDPVSLGPREEDAVEKLEKLADPDTEPDADHDTSADTLYEFKPVCDSVVDAEFVLKIDVVGFEEYDAKPEPDETADLERMALILRDDDPEYEPHADAERVPLTDPEFDPLSDTLMIAVPVLLLVPDPLSEAVSVVDCDTDVLEEDDADALEVDDELSLPDCVILPE